MNRLRALFVSACLLLLGGCASNTLLGRVTDLESGEPIAGATISVGMKQAVSQPTGFFEIEIEAWEQPIETQAEAPGYPTWKRLRSFPRGLDHWNIRLSKTGRYR